MWLIAIYYNILYIFLTLTLRLYTVNHQKTSFGFRDLIKKLRFASEKIEFPLVS